MGPRLKRLLAPRRAALVAAAALTALAVGALAGRPGDPAGESAAGEAAGSERAFAGERRPGPQGSPGAEGSAGASETRRLSDERTRSRWAFVERATVARARPGPAAAVTRLTTRTGDRTPELVLALAERTLPSGRTWVRVRLPTRPNDSTGWVERGSLGRYYTVRTFLRIDRERLRATLYDRGRRVWGAPIAVGRAGAPTPPGRFYVRSRIVPRQAGGIYGVFAFGTNGFSPGKSDWPGGGVVGIHGTDEPELIPGRVSQGCVRVHNADAARLRRLMPLGTPIKVV